MYFLSNTCNAVRRCDAARRYFQEFLTSLLWFLASHSVAQRRTASHSVAQRRTASHISKNITFLTYDIVVSSLLIFICIYIKF